MRPSFAHQGSSPPRQIIDTEDAYQARMNEVTHPGYAQPDKDEPDQ